MRQHPAGPGETTGWHRIHLGVSGASMPVMADALRPAVPSHHPVGIRIRRPMISAAAAACCYSSIQRADCRHALNLRAHNGRMPLHARGLTAHFLYS